MARFFILRRVHNIFIYSIALSCRIMQPHFLSPHALIGTKIDCYELLNIGEYTIYTIGHSTSSIDDFILMLQSFYVRHLIDIRRFPNSLKYPHFNKSNLQQHLKEHGIQYTHIQELGGRRPMMKNSANSRWRNASFRGYADYMQTELFLSGMKILEALAQKKTSAYMCSEAVWWRSHRSMVSDYLKSKGWDVEHIMTINKIEEHPYTSPAIVKNGEVFYKE